jgi:hypothetical protein
MVDERLVEKGCQSNRRKLSRNPIYKIGSWPTAAAHVVFNARQR